MQKIIGLICAGFAAVVIGVWGPADTAINRAIIIFSIVAFLWIFEVFHLSVTALFIPVLAVFLGLMSPTESLSSFSNPVIFLFLGGFALSAALQQQKLDHMFAHLAMKLAGGSVRNVLLLLFSVTALMSMWVSNTACAVIMIPLGSGVIKALPESKDIEGLKAFAVLGLAYSANIGGMGSIIGSPPNAIAASALGISFSDWLMKAMPLMVLLLMAMVLFLLIMIRPNLRLPQVHSLSKDSENLGSGGEKIVKINRSQIGLMFVFFVTVSSWFFSRQIASWFGVGASIDSLIAVSCLVILVSTGILHWDHFERFSNWGILLLFGGGITLSKIMEKTGASEMLGQLIVNILDPSYHFLNLLVLVSFVIFLTELVSNTASAALLIPIFSGFSSHLSLSANAVTLSVAFAASCAFMMPVGTPPNSIAFASGFVKSREMMSVGFFLNLLFSVIISIYVYFVLI